MVRWGGEVKTMAEAVKAGAKEIREDSFILNFLHHFHGKKKKAIMVLAG
jgi:hypothetical protein